MDENGGDDYHFDIDEKNGTVFAYKVIISGVGRYSVKYGLSKCHPNDVFNTDIGKVISFGRAEKLDVREFEQAVQPSEAVVGMVVERNGKQRIISERWIPGETCTPTSDRARYGTIINDTNAIYGGGE